MKTIDKALRKIDLMHREFGYVGGMHICKECKNFIKYRYQGKPYKKCKVYGVTASAASDWANKYEACGMFNIEYHGTPIINLVKRGRRSQDNEMQIDGQITL